MQRHTIRGKTRTIIYPIIIYLGVTSIMGCKRLEINQTKRNWEKLSAYFTPPPLYQEKFGTYRNPLLFYNGDTVKNADDWLKRRKEIKDKWLNLIGHWPAIITNQKLEIIKTTEREDFKQHLVRFYWTPLEQTYGYLLEPNKKGKHPAVITVFYEPETAIGWGGKANRDFAYQLTKRGFVTLSLGTRQTTKDKTYSLYYPTINNSTMQPLSVLAYAAANAWEVLARVESVDSTRIGIMGHSYGAKWAMFASCLYEKFACTAWSDPGIVFDETKDNYINYWEPWYLGYYRPPWKKIWSNNGNNSSTSVYARLCKEGHDLHELHSLLAPRPFLVSGGYSDNVDRWIPLNHSVAVNRLLGYHHRVAMTNRPKHDPTPESNETIYKFFEWFLKRKTPKED